MSEQANYVHVVEGSEQYYCRVSACQRFTARNVPYGYCAFHLGEWSRGVDYPEHVGWPALGTQVPGTSLTRRLDQIAQEKEKLEARINGLDQRLGQLMQEKGEVQRESADRFMALREAEAARAMILPAVPDRLQQIKAIEDWLRVYADTDVGPAGVGARPKLLDAADALQELTNPCELTVLRQLLADKVEAIERLTSEKEAFAAKVREMEQQHDDDREALRGYILGLRQEKAEVERLTSERDDLESRSAEKSGLIRDLTNALGNRNREKADVEAENTRLRAELSKTEDEWAAESKIVAALRAALTAKNWQPIATAPQVHPLSGGDELLLAWVAPGIGEWIAVVGCWRGGWWSGSNKAYPTHRQPLPAMPDVAREALKGVTKE